MTLPTADSQETYVPDFPHKHYHSYAVRGQRLVDLNHHLRIRAEDIAHVANRIGAKSIMDVGSNLGGFLFFLEQFAGRTDLLGVDGDSRFVDECRTVSRLLQSRVQFQKKDIMSLPPPPTPYDAIILQNVYHYIFDKVGSHEPIFRHFAKHGRSIIWYNPMSDKDPVIPQHANSNPNADWSTYNHEDIFKAAMKAGFLHPVPLKLGFTAMGPAREHWLFVRDEGRSLRPQTIALSEVGGEEQPLREHFKGIHKVLLDERYSYKVFLKDAYGQMQRVQAAIESGFIDARVCDGLRYIADDTGKLVGYSQPRGTEARIARGPLDGDVDRDITRLCWILFSRMIRHDVFNHDLGSHNFVFDLASSTPMLIDIENIIDDASNGDRLSIYKVKPDANEITSAEANLNLFFPDVSAKVSGRDPISVLRECLVS